MLKSESKILMNELPIDDDMMGKDPESAVLSFFFVFFAPFCFARSFIIRAALLLQF
jgi:hypothetical protein